VLKERRQVGVSDDLTGEADHRRDEREDNSPVGDLGELPPERHGRRRRCLGEEDHVSGEGDRPEQRDRVERRTPAEMLAEERSERNPERPAPA
jgi:hypothetical protein